MRVKIWRIRGADRTADHESPESPAWNDLEAHARDLEAMGRQIRHDAARRGVPSPNRPFGQRMHQPRPLAPGLKTPSL